MEASKASRVSQLDIPRHRLRWGTSKETRISTSLWRIAAAQTPHAESSGTASVFIGDGTGKFTAAKDVVLGKSPASIALGSLTGSGMDLVVSRSTDNAVAVMHGNGDGTFQAAVPYAVGNNPGSLVVADLNGDGKADVAVANVNDSTVSVLSGRGDGTLLPATAVSVGTGPEALTAVAGTDGGHASLASANGNSGSSTLGTEVTVLSNFQPFAGGTASTTTLSPTPVTSSVNESVTLSVTVAGGSGTPTGTVDITGNGTPTTVCAGLTLDGTGAASCNVSTLEVNTTTLTATYNGNGTYAVSVGTASVTVNALTPTIAFTPAPSPASPSALNTPVTFTAALTGVTLTPVVPSGNMTFLLNGTAANCVGAGTNAITVNSSGVAARQIADMPVGTTNVVNAAYGGDTNFTVASSANSSAYTISKANPTLTLSPSIPTSVNGLVTFTATLGGVTLAPTGPTGTVSFTVGGNPISCNSPATVDSTTGVATCATSALPVGTDVIGATYPGNANYATATAATINQTVSKLSPTLTISPSAASSVNGLVTFTATLGGVTLTPTGPTGTVSFTVGGNPISCNSPATVDSTTGAATCATSALLAGTDVIGATYPGDANYATATAATINQTVSKLSPTLTISPSAPSSVNGLVTFTATLGGVTISPTGPTGTVAFTVGGNPISCNSPATVTPATGVATCATSALPAGTDVIGANYPGDGNYATATAATINQTISKLSPTLTISPSAPSSVNGLVTFTATLGGVSLTPTGPTGTVAFTVGGNPISCNSPATVNSTTGVATCATSVLPAGTDVIGASYPGDSNYATATAATINQTVSKLSPTLTLTSSGATNVNQSVTFTATLSGVTFTPTAPGGSVKFTVGGTTISGCATQSLTGEVATCVTSSLDAGASQSIAAVYTGDSNFNTATGTTTQTVTALAATMTLTPTPGPSVAVGTPVTFTAQITGVAVTPVVPSGTVTFTINGVSNPDCPAVSITVGTCTTSSLLSPADVIKATYSADSNFMVASPVTVTETVGKAPPQVTVTSSLATPVVNQPVTYTATVKPTSGTVLPTGSVTFTLTTGGTVLCNAVSISNTTGIATCTSAFSAPASPGSTVTATYSGDSNFSSQTAVTSSPEVVSAASTTITVTGAPSPSAVNQQVTFTATLTPAFTGTVLPTGTVVFTDTTTSTTLCTKTVSGGVVPVCNYTFTSAGSNSVVATYTSGDSNFTGSASATFTQSVGAGAVSVVLTSSPSPAFVNQLVTFTATINTNSGTTVPQGTMTYTDTSTSTTLCTVTLTVTGIVPACTYAFPTAGSHAITAAFATSNTNFSSGTSNTLTQPVTATSTTTSLSSFPASSAVNQSVAFTAVVTPAFAGAQKPTGTVVFTDTTTSTTLCTKTLSAGVVPVCNFTFTSSGTNNVVATYTSGDSNFTGSVSTADAQSVGVTPTTTTLVSSLPSSAVNQTVTFTATITPTVTGTTNPTGHVAFSYVVNGGSPVTLCASVAVSTTGSTTTAACAGALPANGNYTITAAYSGDTNFGASSATLLHEFVRKGHLPG